MVLSARQGQVHNTESSCFPLALGKQTCHFPGEEDYVLVSKMLFVSGSFE